MDQVEEIKNRLDIVDVIKDYIKLEKAGANYRARCPFHSDKKPSLFVSPSKQIWKCFGCDKGGDVYGFVKEIEGVEFREALEILARKAGVELKKVSHKARSKKKRLYEICDLASRFFEKQLQKSKAGQLANKYLIEERGINKDSIRKWRLGYSPDKWRSLSRFLTSRGFTKEEIRKTGLSVLNKKGNYYDRFRGRIMFPVFDLHGRVIGFGGRVFKRMGESTAKYVNTSNTPLYNKSKVLYGLNKAKVAVREKDACIVTEGYTDVILSSQVGIENIVASSGTALTSYQLRILKRYTDRLQFSFDADSAGSAATRRGIALAQKKGFETEVILMSGNHDPADVIKEKPGKWKELVEEAKGVLEYYFQTAFEKFDPDKAQEKKKIAKTLLPVIKRVPNEIVRFHWIQKIAEGLKVSEESIERELKKVKIKEETPTFKQEVESGDEDRQERQKSKEEMMEDELLYFLIQDPEAAEYIKKEDMEFFSPEAVELFTVFRKEALDPKKLEEELSQALFQKVQMALLRKEVMGEVENVKDEVKKCIAVIKNIRRKEELKALSKRLKEAERMGDESKVKLLTENFNKLSKQIENINE